MRFALGAFLIAVITQTGVAAQSSYQKIEDVFLNIKALRGQPRIC
jgi:hypothetical protein